MNASRRLRRAAAALLIVAVACFLSAGWWALEPRASAVSRPSAVQLEESNSGVVPAAGPFAAPGAAEPGRFVIEALGLDVALLPIAPADGAVEPPTFTDAYVVRFTTPRVVVMHSSTRRTEDGSTAIGNRLWDRDAAKPLLADGTLVQVAGVGYTITGYTVLDKKALPSSDVWAKTGLLIITCAERADGQASTDNIVFFAQRD